MLCKYLVAIYSGFSKTILTVNTFDEFSWEYINKARRRKPSSDLGQSFALCLLLACPKVRNHPLKIPLGPEGSQKPEQRDYKQVVVVSMRPGILETLYILLISVHFALQ